MNLPITVARIDVLASTMHSSRDNIYGDKKAIYADHSELLGNPINIISRY